MLNLTVCRLDNTVLNADNDSTVIFYDEKLQIELSSELPCEAHLSMVVVGSLQDKGDKHSIVIYNESLKKGTDWKELCHIKHPRSPLLNPHLEIIVTAKYTTESQLKNRIQQASASEYLTSLHPIPSGRPGLLVPFNEHIKRRSSRQKELSALTRATSTVSNIDFSGAYEEYISESRSELVASIPQLSDDLEQVKIEDSGIEVVRWKAPLVQALELEIRSLRPALEKDRVIAEIDLLTSNNKVRINSCNVKLDDGLANLMGAVTLPINLKTREKVALTFTLQLRMSFQAPQIVQGVRKSLTLILEYEVIFGNSTSRPKITTVWMPIVDFDGTNGPVPKTPALNISSFSPIIPSHTSNGFGTGNSSTTLDLVYPRNLTSSSSLALMGGITILINGPQFVKVGETFEWNFKVMNRSQRNRMFTMVFGTQPKNVFKYDDSVKFDRISFISNYNGDYLRRRSSTYYHSSGTRSGIVPLCQELRIGNLAPSICFETKLQLQALQVGTHTIDAVKIDDLTTRDSYEVGGLLDVIVEPW